MVMDKIRDNDHHHFCSSSLFRRRPYAHASRGVDQLILRRGRSNAKALACRAKRWIFM